ncbi:MAG: hypothetical protein MUF50_01145 [Planctomycetes bacterium]|jgi:hypothetical protein|nr:hypothetical protein [Planctomycetota bacterium]
MKKVLFLLLLVWHFFAFSLKAQVDLAEAKRILGNNFISFFEAYRAWSSCYDKTIIKDCATKIPYSKKDLELAVANNLQKKGNYILIPIVSIFEPNLLFLPGFNWQWECLPDYDWGYKDSSYYLLVNLESAKFLSNREKCLTPLEFVQIVFLLKHFDLKMNIEGLGAYYSPNSLGISYYNNTFFFSKGLRKDKNISYQIPLLE